MGKKKKRIISKDKDMKKVKPDNTDCPTWLSIIFEGLIYLFCLPIILVVWIFDLFMWLMKKLVPYKLRRK